jgi:hypothetical protein
MRARTSILALGLLAFGACQTTNVEGDVGVISVAITAAPTGVACLRVTVTGATGTASRTTALVPGMPTNGTLSGLPLGQVTVKAEAFDTSCASLTSASIPTWLSDPVTLVLTPGTPVAVTLTMQKAGQISVSVDWNTGGATGTAGAGGATGTAGAGGATGTAGAGGAAGKAGAGGATGTAGAGGATGTAGAGGTGGDQAAAAIMDGQAWLAPCGPTQAFSDLVCQDTVMSACPQGSEYLLNGTIFRNDTVTFGGDPAVTYNVTVRVRGVVEPKHYTGCTLNFATPQEGFASGPTRPPGGSGGCYPSTSGNYGVYMLRVSNPQKTYFFNALNKTEAHFSYPVDYTVTIPVAGGAQLQYLASDSNCSENKNCDSTSVDGVAGGGICNPIVLTTFSDSRIAQPYNGQFLVMSLVSVSH